MRSDLPQMLLQFVHDPGWLDDGSIHRISLRLSAFRHFVKRIPPILALLQHHNCRRFVRMSLTCLRHSDSGRHSGSPRWNAFSIFCLGVTECDLCFQRTHLQTMSLWNFSPSFNARSKSSFFCVSRITISFFNSTARSTVLSQRPKETNAGCKPGSRSLVSNLLHTHQAE